MASAKLLLLVAVTATLSMAASAGRLASFVPIMSSPNANEGYHYGIVNPYGSGRRGSGVVFNPGTEQAQLGVRGGYYVKDGRTHTDPTTMYIVSRNVYKPHYKIAKLPPQSPPEVAYYYPVPRPVFQSLPPPTPSFSAPAPQPGLQPPTYEKPNGASGISTKGLQACTG